VLLLGVESEPERVLLVVSVLVPRWGLLSEWGSVSEQAKRLEHEVRSISQAEEPVKRRQ
jgi:hypothetical protein